LRQQHGIVGPIFMYVGNLEAYQGIDLLLDSFAAAVARCDSLHLVVIGGIAQDVERYRRKASRLGVERRVHLLGPKPVQQLSGYLAQADVLVSPRIKGDNTPMKIYSYLASGKPILATDLWTHRQVLDESVSMLISPTPLCFAEAMVRLAESPELGARLGAAGKDLVEARYSRAAFSQNVAALMDYAAAVIG
jgi:glycosyltransferase involved in cell wall biosynthesis